MLFPPATSLHEGAPTPSIEVNDECYALIEVVPELSVATNRSGRLRVFRDWEEAGTIILKTRNEPAFRAGLLTNTHPGVGKFLTPIRYPSKVVLIGANYHSYVHNMRKEVVR